MNLERAATVTAAGALAAVAAMIGYVGHTAPSHTTRPSDVIVNEDEPGWNCLTMGNRACGPDYVPYTYPTPAAWKSCLIERAAVLTVVCPDGTVVTL